MKPNKAVCLLLSSTVLFCGCYSYSSVAKDKPLPADADARFLLKDGGLLEAKGGQYTRIEGGYQVSGNLVKKDSVQLAGVTGVRTTAGPFSGVIRDAEIEEVTAYQHDGAATVVAIAATVAITGIVAALTIRSLHWR